MDIKSLLILLEATAKRIGVSRPYVVGGTPRDRLLGNVDKIEDLDVTTGDSSIVKLAQEFSRILEPKGAAYKGFPDGHSQVTIEGIKIDFSSNFREPSIGQRLNKAGVSDPSEMQQELYSRDFTVNSLLMTPDMLKIKDPTGNGINDLKAKIIRTNLSPEATLGTDNKRVVRVLYLAAKLGFEVDPEIIAWVKANPASIANVKPKYLADKLQKAVEYDVKKVARLITEMGLWKHVPILTALVPYAEGA